MLELKRDPFILSLYAVCLLIAGALLWKGVLHWEQVAPFFAALLMPSIVGKKGSP
jgi:hypothetical protein